MPDLLKQPVAWAVVGVLALGGVIFAVSRGGGAGPTLMNPQVVDNPATDTVTDLDDEAAIDEAEDIAGADGGESSSRGLTVTVRDQAPPEIEAQLSGFLAVDGAEQCVWLVGLADEDPANLYLIAWPTETEIAWDPFEIGIPGTEDGTLLISETDLVVFDGDLRDSIGVLDDADTARLLGLERCGHDGVAVMVDDAERVSLG